MRAAPLRPGVRIRVVSRFPPSAVTTNGVLPSGQVSTSAPAINNPMFDDPEKAATYIVDKTQEIIIGHSRVRTIKYKNKETG